MYITDFPKNNSLNPMNLTLKNSMVKTKQNLRENCINIKDNEHLIYKSMIKGVNSSLLQKEHRTT